jgi:DNA polymerase (family 10)
MERSRVVAALEEIARLLELQDENPFKVRAYRSAARTLESCGEDLRLLVEQKRLDALPGIGEALRDKIGELVLHGRLEALEKLRAAVPAGVLDLLKVPSLGPKKARVLWKELGIESLEALERACRQDRLLDVKGFGDKSQRKFLEGIAFLGRHSGEFLLSDALPRARRLVEHLHRSPAVRRVEIAGSLRRWKELVHDVDLLAAAERPEEVMEHFLAADGVREVLAEGPSKTSVRLDNGLQVDLRVVTPAQFPAALNYFTGSKEHNVFLRQRAQERGLKLNEYGLFKSSESIELRGGEEIYRTLDLPYPAPELREAGWDAESKGSLHLIENKSLKGALHSHTTWSDGVDDLEAMAEKARSMGLKYLGISDHSKAASYANGLDEVRLAKQMDEVDRLNKRWKGFRLLKGLECDILPDGSLDLAPETLERLDFVIGSIHSRFEMTREEMTARICRALANEHLDILGHPTGRLLLSREGYAVDLDQVLDAARRHAKVVELNAYPNRLDLDWVHCRKAKERGVLLSINPDAHSVGDLDNLQYGIGTARRAGLEAKDVLNSRSADEVLRLLS